jgi:hypothetical protein
MSDQERIRRLWEAQSETQQAVERELVESIADRVDPLRGDVNHVAQVYEVILETGRLTYFKPIDGWVGADAASRRILNAYGHSPASAAISECAAWQLAKRLGEPWTLMVPPTVIRSIRIDGTSQVGSLVVHVPGREKTREYFNAVPELAARAAFFDSLSGQQDRNPGNVRWHEPREMIHLIDHSFAFARPGDKCGYKEIVEWRWRHHARALTDEELQALGRCSHDAFGLESYLEPERAAALNARAEELEKGQILAPGYFGTDD